MVGKGIRKSEVNAGAGKMIILDGDGKWKKVIGDECSYAIKYKGRLFFAIQKCNQNK